MDCMRRSRFLLFVIFLVLFCATPAWSLTLRITNPKVFISAKPGDTVSGKLRVENPTAEPVKIHVEVQDWRYASYDGSKNFFPAGTFHSSCSDWISYAPVNFVLEPYGKQEISYTVKIPENTEGGYFSVMFFQSDLGQGDGGDGVSVSVVGRIGSLFYVDIEGTANRVAEIDNIRIENFSNNFLFQANFMNKGNTYINAKGSVVVLDQDNMVKIRQEINNIYTLPTDTALIDASVAEGLPQGKYLLVLTLDIEQEKTPWVREVGFEIDSMGSVRNIVFGG